MTRILLAVLIVFGVTAFAPAPFPRPSRKGEERAITVQNFQGLWRVASMKRSRATGQHEPYKWHITHVRVKDDRWAFRQNETDNGNYSIVIDNSKRPATLDFFNARKQGGARPSGVGIIRRQGARVEILYSFGITPERRAVSFHQPPDNQWVLLLERQD
jgi:uncharacterized protein (TIGR03067 family)